MIAEFQRKGEVAAVQELSQVNCITYYMCEMPSDFMF